MYLQVIMTNHQIDASILTCQKLFVEGVTITAVDTPTISEIFDDPDLVKWKSIINASHIK